MKLFNELTVGRKLQVYALFVSVIFIFGGWAALNSVERISGYVEHTYAHNMVTTVKISEILERLLEHRILLRRHILSSSMEEMKKTRDEMERIHAEVVSLAEAKDKYHLTGEEEKVFIAFANNLKPLLDGYHEILSLSDVFAKEDADNKMRTESRPIFNTVKSAITKLIQLKEDAAKTDYEASLSTKKNTWLLTILIIFGGIGIVIISSVFITRSISASIGTAVNTISTSCNEIATTVTQHERTANQQATAVTETSATVEQLGASSRQSSEQAGSAATLAQKAMEFTKDGKQRVKEAVGGMGHLKEKVGAVAGHILKLGEQIEQINRIANIVKDLSGQINMLALNAAVEAARAGEHGKGFAVVAGEVRKLADQSKKSAEQANTIIGEIQRSANATIMATEEGSKSAEEVIKLAKMVDDLFGSLSSTADTVYQNAQQVMLNARQQSAAVSQIVEAINAVNLGAKETAAGITQTKTGVERLNQTAGSLKAMV